jgi:hypothetical protein
VAEDIIQVAPNSTGAKLRTRSRTVGANSVHEQYVIALQSDAVPINRVWASTLRIPARVLTAGSIQPLFSIWNGIAGGGNNVSIRRMSVEIDSITAQTVASAQLRLFRQTAASASGSTVAPQQQYTSDPAFNASVVIRADHQADSVNATTPLTAGTLGAAPMWSQTVPRVATLVGFQSITEYNMLPSDSNLMSVDPLILRPGEGCHVQLMAGGAVAAGAYTFTFKAVLAEFTYP